MQPVKLRVAGLSKSYGAFTALAPTDLEVRQGEFLTLLGPSGSGKTTFLMLVAGLNQADGGDIWIDGKLATRMPPGQRDIGMVFQNYALFPHLTVFENIAFPLRMRRMAEADIRREVARVLEIVELPHMAERQPRALSGGQQQRIALARSIVYGPSIVLMDEPLGALDKRLRDQLQIEIKRLHKALGTTILYVTHDQQETLTMSDKICLMNQGRVEQVGTPAELYFSPKTEFGARFLGDSNIIEIDVVVADAGRAPALGGVTIRTPCATLETGARAKIMIRPERMAIHAGAAPSGVNAVEGDVVEVIFGGETTKYFVRAAGGQVLNVLALTDWNSRSIAAGARVTVSWDPAHAVVLSGDA